MKRVPSLLVCLLGSLWLTSSTSGCRANVPAQPPDIATLERRLEITVVVPRNDIRVQSSGRPITAKAVAESDVTAYAPILISELGRYSPQVLHSAGVRRVVLCRDLAYDGQKRGAIPDFDGQCLYLDVLRGAYDKDYLRRVFHHDLYHMIDLRDDGELYQDAAWNALNPPGFHYGNGGISAQKRDDSSLLTDAYPGFLTHYATTGVEEDKAEIFCWLMTNREKLQLRAASDRVLAAKVACITEQARKLGLIRPEE